MLDTLTVVFFQIGDNLPGFAAIFIDRDADAPARRGQCAAQQPGEFAFDVKESDFFEVEQLAIEPEPFVHIALEDVMGQVIEVIKANTARF